MKEVEVKILEQNHADFHDTLLSLGANHLGDVEIEDIIYKKPTTHPSIRVLRLRQIGNELLLTVKVKDKKQHEGFAKILEELETSVGDKQIMRTIFYHLGFEEKERRKKTRYCYMLHGVHVDFDKLDSPYTHIPEFMEIEASTEEEVFHVAQRLGFAKEDCKAIGFQQLKKLYAEKQ